MCYVCGVEGYLQSCPRGGGRRGAPRTAVASCPRPVCLQQYGDETVTSPGTPHRLPQHAPAPVARLPASLLTVDID